MRKLFAFAAGLAAFSLSYTAYAADIACHLTNDAQVGELFNRWNDSLATGNPGEVVDRKSVV